MRKIHLLPDEVAQKIAAGEVIERPVSVVKELVENSIDAGATEVRVELVDGGKTMIKVQDNGAGMDQETRATLFTEFYSTKGPHGTGLGLLVARKVAAEHGGSISVQSAPGEGSTFSVRLPVERKDHGGNT